MKHVAGPQVYDELVKKYLESVRHEWFLKGVSTEQLDKIRKDYEECHGKKGAAAQ